jgi:putative transposase
MIYGVHDERREFSSEENTQTPLGGKNGRTCARSRPRRLERSVQARGYSAGAAIALEAEISAGRDIKPKRYQTRPEEKRGSRNCRTQSRNRKAVAGVARDVDRATGDEKKAALGLDGPLHGRHLTKLQRESLMKFIDDAAGKEPITKICAALELYPRTYYRWKAGNMSSRHGGGGGKNKITPLEEDRVVATAKKYPEWHCRRIAYHLEKTAKVFIGKTKVAEIMKAHGLNHPFEKKIPLTQQTPDDMLLHEPWRKNLLWGMDWTWVNVDGKYMFLLVLLDWYSRKILSWGLHHTITQIEVVTLVTEAVAIERIDFLPIGAMKPTVVADHGSANASKYTKANIEIQGLRLWLSGIGRPTGNARTERVIGTLKREEINLQEQYANESEAKILIGKAIWDYNTNRPNEGNGGFAPTSVHNMGRAELTKRRARARQKANELRRKHWEQKKSPSDSLT